MRGRTAALLVTGRPPALVPAGRLAVLIALAPDQPPRWVVMLAPASVPRQAMRTGSVHLVQRDDRRPDAALLDVTGDPEALAAAAADPRWRTERLPTTGSVAGGWGRATLALLAGVVVGTLLGVGLVLLLRAV